MVGSRGAQKNGSSPSTTSEGKLLSSITPVKKEEDKLVDSGMPDDGSKSSVVLNEQRGDDESFQEEMKQMFEECQLETDEEKIQLLHVYGFSEVACRMALQDCRGNIERAFQFLRQQAKQIQNKDFNDSATTFPVAPSRQKVQRKTGRSRKPRRRTAYVTSKYIGVCRVNDKWRARITINGVLRNLGRFEAELDAVRAYNKAARRMGRQTNNITDDETENEESSPRKIVETQNKSIQIEKKKLKQVPSILQNGKRRRMQHRSVHRDGHGGHNEIDRHDDRNITSIDFGQHPSSEKESEWEKFIALLDDEVRHRLLPMLLSEKVDDVEVYSRCSMEDFKDIGLCLGDRLRLNHAWEIYKKMRKQTHIEKGIK